MRKFYMILLGLILVSINTIQASAEAPKLTDECIEQMKLRDEEYTQSVMKDIKKSFNLDNIQDTLYEVTPDDLFAAHMLYGGKQDDPVFKSLDKHFVGTFNGEPRLFIKPQEAYFLYKQSNNENVMIHLKLVDNNHWEVVDQSKKMGKKVPFKQLACEKEYLKKRNKYHSQ